MIQQLTGTSIWMYDHELLIGQPCEQFIAQLLEGSLEPSLKRSLENVEVVIFCCFFSRFYFLQDEKISPLRKSAFSQKLYFCGFTLFKLTFHNLAFSQNTDLSPKTNLRQNF